MAQKPKRPSAKKTKAGEGKPAPKLAKNGRPSKYSEALVTEICERLSDGESLRRICSDAHMPNNVTVIDWLARHEDFHKRYARARELQADAIFDECLDIADDTSKDWEQTEHGLRFNKEAAARSRIRIDTRMKLAGKLAPKRYGDKLDLTVDDKRPVTPGDRRARIMELMQAGIVDAPASGV